MENRNFKFRIPSMEKVIISDFNNEEKLTQKIFNWERIQISILKVHGVLFRSMSPYLSIKKGIVPSRAR